MATTCSRFLLVASMLLIAYGAANAQQPSPAVPQPQAPPASPAPPAGSGRAVRDRPTRTEQIEVQLIISRWQGDKKIGSLPYTLSVNADDQPPQGVHDLARLRIGAEVPVVALKTPAAGDATSPPAAGAVTYKAIGTNIDCTAALTEDGRYRLQITIEDSSVYADDRGQAGTLASANTPIFRSFRLSNTATLRDGQSTQFTAAADKISGEIVRVDVSVKAMK